MYEWGIGWLEIASYFQQRRVEFTVREKPEEALAAVRGFLDKGPFGEVTRTDTMLEMRGPLVQKIGCIGWIILAVLSFGTAFTIWLAFMVVILLTPKPTVLVEAEGTPGKTCLTITGRPVKTIALTEQWVRENLEVE